MMDVLKSLSDNSNISASPCVYYLFSFPVLCVMSNFPLYPGLFGIVLSGTKSFFKMFYLASIITRPVGKRVAKFLGSPSQFCYLSKKIVCYLSGKGRGYSLLSLLLDMSGNPTFLPPLQQGEWLWQGILQYWWAIVTIQALCPVERGTLLLVGGSGCKGLSGDVHGKHNNCSLKKNIFNIFLKYNSHTIYPFNV